MRRHPMSIIMPLVLLALLLAATIAPVSAHVSHSDPATGASAGARPAGEQTTRVHTHPWFIMESVQPTLTRCPAETGAGGECLVREKGADEAAGPTALTLVQTRVDSVSAEQLLMPLALAAFSLAVSMALRYRHSYRRHARRT